MSTLSPNSNKTSCLTLRTCHLELLKTFRYEVSWSSLLPKTFLWETFNIFFRDCFCWLSIAESRVQKIKADFFPFKLFTKGKLYLSSLKKLPVCILISFNSLAFFRFIKLYSCFTNHLDFFAMKLMIIDFHVYFSYFFRWMARILRRLDSTTSQPIEHRTEQQKKI